MDPDEFLEKLHSKDFQRELVFEGMAKEDENEEDAIQFAYGTNCENWTSIPVEKIKSVDELAVVPCKDHSHPFVQLSLQAPETDEGAFFVDLLESITAQIRQPTPPPVNPRRTDHAHTPDTDEANLFKELIGAATQGGRPNRLPTTQAPATGTNQTSLGTQVSQCSTYCFWGTLWCVCPHPPGVEGWEVYPCGSCFDPDRPPVDRP